MTPTSVSAIPAPYRAWTATTSPPPPTPHTMGTQAEPGGDRDIRSTIATYAGRTTAHGIGRVHGSRGTRRALWGSLVLFSTTFVLYQIVTLIQKYTKFDIETELKVSYNRHMYFPAVTVCNLNALRLSKVIDPRYLPRDLLTSLPGLRQHVVTVYRDQPWLLNYTGLGEANLTDPYLIQLREEILQPAPNPVVHNETFSNDIIQILHALDIPVDKVMEVEPGRLKQALYAVLLAYVDEDVVARVGHQADQLIIKCAFDGIRCNYTQFSGFETDSFGNCYTFNSGRDGSPIRKMGYSGPTHALRLELNVEQYEYVTYLQETAGARVVIHDQGIRPFPNEEGITVAPGYHTSIGINRNGITRLGMPHGTCTNGALQDTLPSYRYSVMGCLKLCLERAVVSECRCRVPLLPTLSTDIPVCRFDHDKEDYLCMLRVASRNPSLNANCTCPESCHELSFNPLLSFGDWPNDATQEKGLEQMIGGSKLLDQMPKNYKLKSVRSNMLRLDLYYQELNDIQIVQRESYALLSLVSDIGGQMGLWIGMSVLSLCEGLELLVDILKMVLHRGSMLNQGTTAKTDVTPRN